LNLHKNKKVKELYDELKIIPIRLVAYNSHFNSAEFVFKLAKEEFRKVLLKQL